MMFVYYFFIIFITSLATDTASEYAVDLFQLLSKKQHEMKSFLAVDRHIDEVIFNVQGTISFSECAIITGWKAPYLFSHKVCERGIAALAKKKLFKTIHLAIEKEGGRSLLYCTCEPLNVVAKIEWSGIRFGKEHFFSYYDVQVGNAFSLEKHQVALKKVIEAFQKAGYVEIKITDTILHDDKKHEVIIKMDCDRGKKFVIENVIIHINSFEDKQYQQLQDELYQRYAKKLIHQTYQEKTVLASIQDIEDFVAKIGFAESLCTYEYKLNNESQTVTIDLNIKLGQKRLFTFVGNSFYSSHELSQLLNQSGNTVWLLPPSLLAQDLVLLYRKKGFWSVTVKVEKSGQETFFIIHEGKRICIKDIVCKGLPEITHKNKNNRFFKSIIKQNYFDEDLLQQAIDKVFAFYRQEGFWDISLNKKNYEQIADGQEYNIVLLFNQGERRIVNRVIIKDFPHLEHRGPFAIINGDTLATPMTKVAVQEQQEWLIDYFRKQGHADVQVSSIFDKNKDESLLIWTVDHLKTIYCGKTIVQGKSPIEYKKLLTFMDYKEGDEWKKESLLRSYSNLRTLDIFKYIALYPDAYDATKLTRDVILHLQEDEPYEFRLRLGLQQVSKNFAFKKGSTYKVGTTFIAKNVTHNVDTIRFDADFTRFERNVELSYQLPHPFLLPVTILTKAYANKYTQPITLGSRKTLYEATQEGFLTSITGGYHALSYGSNIGFEWMKTKDISVELAQAINFKTDLINKKILYFFIEPTIFIDLLDDKINPTRGMFGVGSRKGMSPFKEDAYFIKLMIDQGVFFPLSKYRDIICAARVRFGHIFNEMFSKIMPPERFYLGGANSLRGYLPDACPPLGTYVDQEGKTHHVPQGGKTMLNMNVELRIPFTKTFVGAVFQDFGVLVEDVAVLHDTSNTATSTGFGIRYLTPIGPLRFDIGFKWKTSYEHESRYAWFLTLGNAF